MRKIFLFIVALLFCAFSINAQNKSAEENAALSLVSASKAALGLSAEDLSNVMVLNTYIDETSGGVRRVYLIQTYKGVPVYNQILVLAFKGEKLVSQAGRFNHGLEKMVNVSSAMASVTAESAVQSALSDRGLHASQMAIAINRKENGRMVEFGNMGVSRENITAKLMWTPLENGKEVRLSWHVYIIPKTTADYWMVRVDAVDNSILGMDNYTDYDHWGIPDLNNGIKYPGFSYGTVKQAETEKNLFDFKTAEDPSLVTTATYRVIPFPAEAPSFPNGAHALRTDPWTAAPGNATTLRWHTGAAAADYSHTRSNNVFAYQDRVNDNNGSVADAASSSTAFPNLTFDFTPDYTQPPTQTTPVPNQQFNITNLFYWNNVIHDVMYIYGFTEPAANFQDDNLGRGGAGNDHVNAEAQDGGGTNNANFATPADGGSGRMQMYLWTGGTPQRDGDVDNGIIVHEFGHGISNRLTGGGTGGCLGNAEQMGEGWSDYYGLMFTHDWSTATLNQGFTTPRGIGTYALFQPPTGTGIRTQRYCTDFTINNKVYLATLPAGPHPRGEIWAATLWDMTWNIINQVGTINPNLYNLAGGGGNTIAMKLVTEGLKLQQCNPGFISGRNAILQADQNLYGGLYNCAIWEAFRRRGMGAFASEGSTASVNDQVPDFTPPVTLGATVSASTIPEGQNLNYVNALTTCSAISGYTLRDTLPTNVTYVSGGTYDAATRVVSWSVNQAAGTTNYPFTVNVNPGSYFPPVTLLNETVAAPTIPAAWTTAGSIGTPWTVSTTVSNSAPNSFYVVNLTTAGDQRLATTASFALPNNSYPELSFWHRWNTEDGWDGGVVEISTNGGTTWSDVGAANFTLNGYNGGLGAAPTNALSGRAAFTGLQNTFINSKINLASYNGQSVMIRFRFGSDDNTSAPTNPAGWWVDDITLSYKAAVNMRTSLFNASNARVSYRDMITEITQLTQCNPTITQQPVDATVCAGSAATFTTVGTAVGGVTYQWQISTTGIGGTYTNLANGAPYSGVTTSTLTVNPTTVAMDGHYFRAVVTGTCNPTATSNPARLNVATSSIQGTVTPATSQVCGTTNSGTLTVAGHNGNIVRWESATNIAGPWTPIANTTTTYTFTNITQTMFYRAVSQFGTCSETPSTIATVNFVASAPIMIVADPGTTVCAGDPTRLTVHEGSLTGGTIPLNNQTGTFSGSVRGYYFTAPAAFTMTALRVPTDASAGNQHIAVVRFTPPAAPPAFPATTNAFTVLFLTQNNTTVGNIPVNIPIAAGDVIGIMGSRGADVNSYSATPNVTNIGGTPVTLLRMGMQFPLATTAPQQIWSENAGAISRVFFDYTIGTLGPVVTTGTFLWTPAAGLSSTTSNPVAASPMQTTTYTVNHNNGAGCIRQANITITVNQRPVVTSNPANTTACANSTATFTVAGTGTALAYQWQVSTTGPGGPWTNLANAAPYSGVTTATLTINPVSLALNGNNYRAVLTGTCAPYTPPTNVSSAAVLTVNAQPTVTVTPTSGCGGVAGTNGLALTASGANTYTWAPTAGLYTDPAATIPYTGGNAATVYAAPTVFTTYTVTGTNTTTGCSNTASAMINYTPPAPTVTPSSVTMCLGDPAVKLKSSSSVPGSMNFTSGTVNIAIPDGPTIPPVPTSYPATTSNITVSGIPAGATVTAVRARFNITHAWVSDLVMALRAPNGQIVNLDALLNRTNQAGANFTNTVISSAATNPLGGAAPYTGTFADDAAGATFTALGFTWPGGPTGYIPTTTQYTDLFNTGAVNGVWSVGIYDAGAPDGGTLNNWSLDIDYVIGVPATPAVWTPAAGLFSDANATIPYVAGTAVDSVWTRPTPSGVYTYQATVQSLGLPPTAIQTTFTNNNQFGLVTSNIRNNNPFPITVTGIESIASASGLSTATLYFKTTPVAGPPGAISVANGWNVVGTGSYTAIANTTTTTPQPMLSGLTFVIPANTTYGIAFESKITATNVGNLRYSTVAAGTYTNSAGGADLISGTNVSYAGDIAPAVPGNTPRAFIGRVLIGNSTTPCTSPARTVVVTVNQPTTLNANLPADQTLCTDKVATFTAAVTAGSGPHSYQWQVSTDGGNTFTNIANGGVYSGATTATLTVTAPPTTMNGYRYRAVVTGAAPCAAQTSRVARLTVNPLPVIVISANPTSLYPGLTTTINSTVSPNAAATYTWLRNGVVVPNASTGTLNVDVDGLGVYTLRVTDVNGCTSTSNALTIKDSVNGKCFIYPNPTSGMFQVRYYSVANNVLPRTLTVYDAKGDRVFTKMYTIGRPYDRMDVDMRAYGKGLYWVEIGDLNGSRLSMCRVVIQ